MIHVYTQQRAKKVMFSENSSIVLPQWSHGVNAGTLRSMKIKLRPSTSPIDAHQSQLFLHWKDGKFPS